MGVGWALLEGLLSCFEMKAMDSKIVSGCRMIGDTATFRGKKRVIQRGERQKKN